jgi:hypothetical protein
MEFFDGSRCGVDREGGSQARCENGHKTDSDGERKRIQSGDSHLFQVATLAPSPSQQGRPQRQDDQQCGKAEAHGKIVAEAQMFVDLIVLEFVL